MKPGYFSALAGLGVFDLVEREKRARELLDLAEQHQQQVALQLVESAAERVESGDVRAGEVAERDQRLAAQRVADCRVVLGQVQAAAEAARVVAFGEEQARAQLGAAPDRRRSLVEALERAQFLLGQKALAFEGASGAWMTIEKPKPHPPQRRLTLLGQRLLSERDGAQAEVDRIRAELREIDALLGDSARQAAA